jgi:hypothetical protein
MQNAFMRTAATHKGKIALTVALIAGAAYLGKLTNLLVLAATVLVTVAGLLMRLGTYTAAMGW